MCRKAPESTSLALHTASHHLAALVKDSMEYVRMQHCQSQGLGSIENACSISTHAVSTLSVLAFQIMILDVLPLRGTGQSNARCI